MNRDNKIKELTQELEDAQTAVTAENKLPFSPNVAVLRDVVFQLARRLEHIKASIFKEKS